MITRPCSTRSVVRSSLLLCSLLRHLLGHPPSSSTTRWVTKTRPTAPTSSAPATASVASSSPPSPSWLCNMIGMAITRICGICRPYNIQCFKHFLYVEHLCHWAAIGASWAKYTGWLGFFQETSFFFACYFSLKTCLLQKHTIPVNYNTKIAFLFEKKKEKNKNTKLKKRKKRKKELLQKNKKVSHFLELY